jgi:hypothetical protein
MGKLRTGLHGCAAGRPRFRQVHGFFVLKDYCIAELYIVKTETGIKLTELYMVRTQEPSMSFTTATGLCL